MNSSVMQDNEVLVKKVKYTPEEVRDHFKKWPVPKGYWKLGGKKRGSRSLNILLMNSKEWNELRRKVLDLYGSVCMCCGSEELINVDHIKPKSKYPELALCFDNLQILCWECNKQKGNKTIIDYRKAK